MTSISEQFLKAVGKHFVSLSCVRTDEKDNPIVAHIFSGFVIEVLEEWFLVTAGHVLSELREAMDAGARFRIWRLGDQTGSGKYGSKAIPFDFDVEDWLVISDDENGMDYAATPLLSLFRAALERGGIVPLSERVWGNPWNDEFTRRVLVGIPKESASYDGVSVICAKFALAPMQPADPPLNAERKIENQFFSKLDEDPSDIIKNLKGMSGGPIFSCKIEGSNLHYKVLGVQSSWYPSQRIVAACPIGSFGKAIEQAIKEAANE